MIYVFEDYSLDVDRRELRRGAHLIAVEPQAFDFLRYLISQRERVVSKDDLIGAVWGGRIVSDATVSSRITTVRQAVNDSGEAQRLIKTFPRKGIRFIGTVQEENGPAPTAAVPTRAEQQKPALALPERPSIAVLPFNSMSGDPDQEYLADGVVEEIITALSRMGWLFVIARNSSFTYKGRAVDVKQVARELGVRYVLEGSVRRSGGRVRVTAQLIEADTGHHLVAEKYDRELSDLFELQDEIATTIAGAIEPEMLKCERNRVASHPQNNQTAYELYQRGMWHHYRQAKADNIEAQAYFRRALSIAPEYSQAMAALGLSICTSALRNWSDDPERCYAAAFELAQRAITLDSRDPVPHFVMGLVCMWTSRFDRSMAEMKEAIKLNPSFAAAHCVLAQTYVYAGHPEEAVPLAEEGIRLSPNDPRLFMWFPALAAAHYQLRHYEQAVEIGGRAWGLNRTWPAGLRYVVAGLAQLGRIEEAQAALADLKRLETNHLAVAEEHFNRLYKDRAAADHMLEGLRKAGFE